MKRFLIIPFFLLAALALSAQAFPEAQKQPRPSEMKKQQRKYKKQSKRRHHKMKSPGASNDWPVLKSPTDFPGWLRRRSSTPAGFYEKYNFPV
jgi:hypothetical protein